MHMAVPQPASASASSSASAPELAKPVGAVIASVQILRHLSRAGQPQRLSQISQALSLNNSTCFNILRTLHHEGLVTFDRQSRLYAVGEGLLELAAPLLGRTDGMRRFRATMDAMAQDLGATLAMWQRAGDEIELLCVAEPPETMRIAFTEGRRLPLYLGAMGRLMAARSGLDADALRPGFQRVRWAQPPDFAQWLDQVAQARASGYAVDHGNINRGILGLAVPVETSGDLHRVCCATLFEGGQDEREIDRLVERLRALAIVARSTDQSPTTSTPTRSTSSASQSGKAPDASDPAIAASRSRTAR